MPRRTDGLYKHAGYFYFKYKTDDGGWKEQATHTKDYDTARNVRTDFLLEQQQGKLPNERAKWTLKQATDDWLEERKLRVANGSYSSEKTIVKNLMRVLKQETRLEKLADSGKVRAYENFRLREKVSAKTVNNETMVLAGILKRAKLWHRVEADYKRLTVEESDIGDTLTQEQGQRLLQVARMAGEDQVVPYAAVLSYSTGMRSNEIKKLQLKSIHLNSCQIQVRRATTKTNKGARFVAMDTMAKWAMGKLLNRAERLGATEPEHYLLPTRLDKHTRETDPLHGIEVAVDTGWCVDHPQSSWEKEWKTFRKLAKIEHRRFHDLRHTYITRAAESGVPVQVIQSQVGHMSEAMVHHYTHISQAAIHKAVELMEKQNPELLAYLGIGLGDNHGDPN